MNKLIYNEMLKLVKSKRLLVVTIIIGIMIMMFTYAQHREMENVKKRIGDTDWRVTLQQSIVDMQNRIGSSGISEEFRSQLKVRIDQSQYYLDHNINPQDPGAPTFLRVFLDNSIQLLLPLMVMIISADMVSSEKSLGTIKLLLTRPVRRWKILLSKYITLILSVSFILLMFGLFSYLISGLFFGYTGWTAPVLTGFTVEAGELNTANVHLVPQWQYILMIFGLGWFVSVVVGTLSFMFSVLIKSTAAGMGAMLAFLISGTIISSIASSWESAKYFFMVNLRLTDYLQGNIPPIEGMSLPFSLMVLSIWGLAGIIISFLVFTRRDVY
ncbi:ABC transporter permease [Niallia circulans]|uniref:ABC transporter permease n=1 Tax=Niallia circulans TaxID=1397 RepID=A0A268FDA8_NIACI|nr:ABC transporter permease [Niallia circulans]AYV69755.1 ABC transporter permease [Niallia circulans]PAD83358.1 ABC transporter permease [Niallia circulans]QJX61238.1 ABC transporter permease [Niallia circulans]